MRFLVRPTGSGEAFVETEGDLAVGGIFFKAPQPPQGTRLDIRFKLPGQERELEVQGELIDYRSGGRVRFVDIDVKAELAIAKYLDDLA
jgi:hypothetical protein